MTRSDRPGQMIKLTYTGPPHMQCHELTAITGAGLLEHGSTHEVPDEFAARLLASSAHFALSDAATKPPTKAQLQARAAELGLSLPHKATVAALAAAITAAEDALAVAKAEETEPLTAEDDDADGDAPEDEES